MAGRNWQTLAPPLLLAALASCGATNHAGNQTNGVKASENASAPKLNLTSSGFQAGQPIPAQFTCDGANHSPPLSWNEPPHGTESFALVVDDPDAPGGTFRHWGIHDIPASARSIREGQHIGSEVSNDFGNPGYGGPCPPRGHGPHHYHFRLFALDVDKLALGAEAKAVDLENAASNHSIAQGELIGTYERR